MNYKYVIRMDLLHDTAQQVIEEFHKDVIKLVKRMEKSHHEQLVHLGFVDRVIRRMHKSGLRSAKYQVGLQRLSSNKVAPEVLASDCSRTFSVASKSRKKTKLKKISNASTALSDNITERFLEVASTRRSTFNSFSVAMSSPAPSSRSTSQSSY